MEMPFIMGSLGSFLRAGANGRASFDVPLEIVEAGAHAIFFIQGPANNQGQIASLDCEGSSRAWFYF
jgi:hypothetical protein